jgi:hypothetical protein
MTFVLQPVPENTILQGAAKGGKALGLSEELQQCEATTS